MLSLETRFLCWPFLRGRVAGEKCGNTGYTDTHSRWSQAGIASQPILPTPAMARTKGSGRTRRRFCLRQSLRQWKHLNILSPPVGGPPATKRAPCHIHPSHRSEKDRLPLKRGRLGQETAHHTHPARPVAFGPWSQALLSLESELSAQPEYIEEHRITQQKGKRWAKWVQFHFQKKSRNSSVLFPIRPFPTLMLPEARGGRSMTVGRTDAKRYM
jgi:hypothetical protein